VNNNRKKETGRKEEKNEKGRRRRRRSRLFNLHTNKQSPNQHDQKAPPPVFLS